MNSNSEPREPFKKFDIVEIDKRPAVLLSDEDGHGWAEILFLYPAEKYRYHMKDRKKLGQIVWDSFFDYEY